MNWGCVNGAVHMAGVADVNTCTAHRYDARFVSVAKTESCIADAKTMHTLPPPAANTQHVVHACRMAHARNEAV